MKSLRFLGLVVLSVLVVSACSGLPPLATDPETRDANWLNWTRTPHNELSELHIRSEFIATQFRLNFDCLDCLDEFMWAEAIGRSGAEAVEFVQTQEECQPPSSGVLCFWAGEDTHRIFDYLNYAIPRSVEDLSAISMSFPLTITGLSHDDDFWDFIRFNFPLNAPYVPLEGGSALRGFEEMLLRDASDHMTEKARYAEFWQFSTNHPVRDCWSTQSICPYIRHLEGKSISLTSITFVTSETEAVNFDDDVLVLWPAAQGSHFERTGARLDALNEHIKKLDLYALAPAIAPPIRRDDLINHWEDVWVILHMLPENERQQIRDAWRVSE